MKGNLFLGGNGPKVIVSSINLIFREKSNIENGVRLIVVCHIHRPYREIQKC
jgi:hypothetical protein